jgi:hypothetical protein
MKKIKITENELISLIEKIVNENLGVTPSLSAKGGGFVNLGMGKPTDKYKDLYEDDDIENEVEEDQDPQAEKSANITVTTQPGSDDEDAWMESIVQRLKGKLNEDDDWMQGVDKDIEKRGTEGVFHKFCIDNGFKDGCSRECWAEAKRKGGVWSRRAGLARAYCESK